MEDALDHLAQDLDAFPIAGGTDLLPRIRRRQVPASKLLDLSGLAELRYIKQDAGKIRIGALTTISDLERLDDKSVWARLLKNTAKKFGSPNIRSIATIGGNVCAASSSEDLLPVFLVLDARVKTIAKDHAREMPLRDFIVEKRKTTLEPGEILAEVSFMEPTPRAACSFQKLGMRSILIIALVSVAALVAPDETNSRFVSARVALNRLNRKTPQRAESVEKELINQTLDETTVSRAVEALGRELTLTSDFRASADYRREAVKVLLRRSLLDCRETILKR